MGLVVTRDGEGWVLSVAQSLERRHELCRRRPAWPVSTATSEGRVAGSCGAGGQ